MYTSASSSRREPFVADPDETPVVEVAQALTSSPSASSVDDAIVAALFGRGVPLWKLTTRRGRRIEKVLRLDDDRSQVFYSPSRKPLSLCSLFLHQVKEIHSGVYSSAARADARAHPDSNLLNKAQERLSIATSLGLVWDFVVDPALIKLHFNHRDPTSATPRTAARTPHRDSVAIFVHRPFRAADIARVLNGLALSVQRRACDKPCSVVDRMLWHEADENGDCRVILSEVKKMMHRANVSFPSGALRNLFRTLDERKVGYLEYGSFCSLLHALRAIPAFQPLFVRFSTRGKATPDDVATFIASCQYGDSDDAETIIRRYSTVEGRATLDAVDFLVHLCDAKHNSWFKPKCRDVYMDMDRPLRDYFINSGHNSYLTGDQLASASDVRMYRYALLRGYRCLEVDCWDGSSGEPIVYHGYTATSKILFRDVMEIIRDCAFVTSPYPVILSLEVHCGVDQQTKMAQYMVEIFGSMLLRPHQDDNPTPNSAKGKILLKYKRPFPVASDETNVQLHLQSFGVVEDDGDSDDDGDADVDDAGASAKRKNRRRRDSNKRASPARGIVDTVKVAHALNDVITVPSVTFKGWAHHFTAPETLPTQIVSLGETRLMKIVNESPENGAGMVKMNTKMLTRIYPKGSRVSSSNYEPQGYWNVGCQIVALNVQTRDFAVRYNESKFKQNGNCGYVLKPKYMRHDSVTLGSYAPKRRYVLHVRVLLGQLLPKPNLVRTGERIDPYVCVFVSGVGPDNSAMYCTRYCDDNGFNPVWQQMVSFPLLCLEMAMLTVRVMDKDIAKSDDEIAEASIPITCLRLGYRAVPLRNMKDNQRIPFSSVLCHFSLELAP